MTHCATVHRGSTAQQAGGTWGNTVYTMATFTNNRFQYFYTFFTLLQPFCCAVYGINQDQTILLEPVCCKKQQKKVPDQLMVCGIGDL